MIAAIDHIALEPSDTMLTVGLFNVTPNAPSVVPSEVLFSIDLRHPDNNDVDRVDQDIRRIVEAEKGTYEIELKQIAYAPSLTFPSRVRATIAQAAERIGIVSADIYSSAGHDARQLHYFCPTGMIFVPCRAGVSHSSAEWAEPEHLTAAMRVLTDAVWELANAR